VDDDGTTNNISEIPNISDHAVQPEGGEPEDVFEDDIPGLGKPGDSDELSK